MIQSDCLHTMEITMASTGIVRRQHERWNMLYSRDLTNAVWSVIGPLTLSPGCLGSPPWDRFARSGGRATLPCLFWRLYQRIFYRSQPYRNISTVGGVTTSSALSTKRL